MSNDNDSNWILLSVAIDSSLNNAFVDFVESGSGLIEQQNSWFLQKGSCNCNSLLLSSGKWATTTTDNGIETCWNIINEVPGVSVLKSLFNLLISRIWLSKLHIFSNRCIEQDWFLANVAHESSELSEIESFDGLAIDHDSSTVILVESFNHLNNSRLSWTWWTDQSCGLTWFEGAWEVL